MTQEQRLIYLIEYLVSEGAYSIDIPKAIEERKRLLRALMNVRMPKPASTDFLSIQDEYLREELERKGITDYKKLKSVEEGIYLWQGDITTLKCGASVNAANSGMTGCYHPLHGCIDNCMHTYSGVQLRLACAELMKKQGFDEPVGRAKITPAFNLPCSYVIHTVGPLIMGSLTDNDRELLASCYRSCLMLADENNISSIAFCCISTGEFHFPNDEAAHIAVNTVRDFKSSTKSKIEVIFNVFKEADYRIYAGLLGADKQNNKRP